MTRSPSVAGDRLLDEYLEADGLGGFASGTVGGVRTRKYHATLLVATTPRTARVVLVAGFDAWVEQENTRQFLTSQRYVPDVGATEGQGRLVAFTADPWPTWTFRWVSHSYWQRGRWRWSYAIMLRCTRRRKLVCSFIWPEVVAIAGRLGAPWGARLIRVE